MSGYITYIMYDARQLNGAAFVDVVLAPADNGCCRYYHGHVVVMRHDTSGRGNLKEFNKSDYMCMSQCRTL